VPSASRWGITAALLLAACAASGCNSVKAKAWNLDQLHDGDSHHRYHAALENDFEFFLRHEATAFLSSTGASFAQKDPAKIDDPSQRCLEFLVELEDAEANDARSRALQIEWCARLCAFDPASLCRERATLALGRFGVRIEAGMPRPLPAQPPAATAEAVAGAATALVRAVRGVVDPASLKGESAPTIAAACSAIEALVLDIDGARRALNALGQLESVRALPSADRAQLEATAVELEKRLVRQAIARALKDRDARVRAAAVSAAVACGGLQALEGFVLTLRREEDAIVVLRVLELVLARGLGEAPPEMPENERAKRREEQLASLYTVLVTRPSGDVRVAAMRALARVSGSGIESLREEDWQAWWLARRASAAGAAETKPAS
jgi:hypothetical protein